MQVDVIEMRAGVLEPLHNLLRKDVAWSGSLECEKAFQHSKERLAERTLLVPFDPSKPVVLTVDASSYGVGAVLSHIVDGSEQPIFFESASLTTAERN